MRVQGDSAQLLDLHSGRSDPAVDQEPSPPLGVFLFTPGKLYHYPTGVAIDTAIIVGALVLAI